MPVTVCALQAGYNDLDHGNTKLGLAEINRDNLLYANIFQLLEAQLQVVFNVRILETGNLRKPPDRLVGRELPQALCAAFLAYCMTVFRKAYVVAAAGNKVARA